MAYTQTLSIFTIADLCHHLFTKSGPAYLSLQIAANKLVKVSVLVKTTHSIDWLAFFPKVNVVQNECELRTM